MDVIEQVVNLIINNGIGVACVFYLIYFQHTTMRDLQKNMYDMTNILGIIKDEIKEIKEKTK